VSVAFFDTKDSDNNCGTACEVLLRARSDIGFNKFSRAFPDFDCGGSKFDICDGKEDGGVGSLAPVGLLPVCICLPWRSDAVTNAVFGDLSPSLLTGACVLMFDGLLEPAPPPPPPGPAESGF
jgi:hypothetical protein